MQAAKDSFYMALRDRLAALDPARVIVVDGVERPAIIVRENSEPQSTAMQCGAYYIDWGAARILEGARPVVGISCTVSYSVEGSTSTAVDRGRQLGQMDQELLRICTPPYTGMRDYAQSPSVDLRSGVFWTMPELKTTAENDRKAFDTKSSGSTRLDRQATMHVYFWMPEAGV